MIVAWIFGARKQNVIYIIPTHLVSEYGYTEKNNDIKRSHFNM